jgi:hypothetical protein
LETGLAQKSAVCNRLARNSLLKLTGKLFRGTGIFDPTTANFICNCDQSDGAPIMLKLRLAGVRSAPETAAHAG